MARLRADNAKVNLGQLEHFALECGLAPITSERVLSWVQSACGVVSLEELVIQLTSNIPVIAEDIYTEVKIDFIEQFKRSHERILPLSRSKVAELCKERSIDFNCLRFSEESGLVCNACMAPTCPFFLKPLVKLSRHLGTWSGNLPAAFHSTVMAHRAKHPAFIFAKFVSGSKMRRNKPSKDLEMTEFHVTDEWVIEYIKDVIEACNKIAVEDDGWAFAEAQ